MVLGSLFLDPQSYSQISGVVDDSDFYVASHRIIFDAIFALASDNKPFDIVSVSQWFDPEDLNEIGGLSFLRELRDNTPTATNIRRYAEEIRERSLERRLLLLGPDIEHAWKNRTPAAEIIKWIRESLDQVESGSTEEPITAPIDWSKLAGQIPPERDWIIPHWFGAGYVTLLYGPGGIGKTGLAQAMASCIALKREFLDWIARPRVVLMWAGEDDHDELWRRQIAVAKWLGVPLEGFDASLHIISYDREDIELAGLIDQRRLVESPKLKMLREQIGDYKAEVVILDSLSRVYGGDENSRHQAHQFVAMLNKAAEPTHAGIMLLGHPAKATDSEYSGSTAWDAAARGRLYFGRKLPDQEEDDEAPQDDTLRYLARRKANYSSRDWRKVHYKDGVLIPEVAPEPGTGNNALPGKDYSRDIVARAVRKLAEMREWGNNSPSSPSYLPKLAKRFQLLDRLTEKQFKEAMSAMQVDKALVKAVVGKYQNRTEREGLVLPDMTPAPSDSEVHK